jgi:glyoxalase-like protein
MTFEIDHLIVWTAVGAPEAEILTELGLTEGSPNLHSGQGTANRRFFFHNAYLELLWVHDAQEAKSKLVLPMRLLDRWSGRTRETCPFGLCFRPVGGIASTPPFSAWEYRPAYLPDPHCILVGTNIDNLVEPMLFYLDLGRRPDEQPPARRQPLKHSASVKEISQVHVVSPHGDALSPELRSIVDSGLVSIERGEAYLMEIGFDSGEKKKEADLRPALPLSFKW